MRVLLISLYELGHQPLHVASPAARLMEVGHDVRGVDLSVTPFESVDLAWADKVAISVPMHTAMRLAVDVVEQMKALREDMPVCLYGLYAGLVPPTMADRVIGGEYEAELMTWVSDGGLGRSVDISRQEFLVPARHILPALAEYAHLSVGGDHRVVGYTEASHGCRHRCKHCPIPALYDGMFRIVGIDTVVADVDQLVELGAEHITLGDPDFLNGPAYALKIIRALHERHPSLTFDVTIKVEHLVSQSRVLEELAECGVLFIVSAFESTNDRILELLDKGHTSDEMGTVVEAVRAMGMEIRPTFLPFTPWTTRSDILNLFEFLERWNLDVDPIQMAIRLLVPEDSLLISTCGSDLDGYDEHLLGYRWSSPLDSLQREFASIVESGEGDMLNRMFHATLRDEGLPARDLQLDIEEGRPRLTEPWFC